MPRCRAVAWLALAAAAACCRPSAGAGPEARALEGAAGWSAAWSLYPYPTAAAWSLQTRIPMTGDFVDTSRQERGKYKMRKKFKKLLLPLLLAYKLKFFTLIPVLIGGLVLLTGATGLAGFFFALFAAVMGLKSGGHT